MRDLDDNSIRHVILIYNILFTHLLRYVLQYDIASDTRVLTETRNAYHITHDFSRSRHRSFSNILL